MNDREQKKAPAIEIQGLQKRFRGKNREDVFALRGVSFSVQRGEVFGFLGPNGAGKTTTIKILMGLIAASGGTAMITGMDVGIPAARRNVGYLPENPSFYDYLTASEYLQFTAKLFRLEPTRRGEGIEAMLRLLDLWDARDRTIRQFSKGMVQRLGLAQALIHDPAVLILDEPMSGLDPVGRALVKKLILESKERGRSVFFSTHITSDVEAVCDRVGIILKGSLQSVEKLSSIMTEGIIGYHIHYRAAKTGLDSSLSVPKENLQRAMDDLRARGDTITLIDPQRKDLESFFLDIVKGQRS